MRYRRDHPFLTLRSNHSSRLLELYDDAFGIAGEASLPVRPSFRKHRRFDFLLPTVDARLLMLKDWEKIGSKLAGDFRIFKIRSDEKISPRTGRHCDFFVIESVDWVNVIAVTPNDELVMVEQYRHGSNTVELEIPGGMMDPHENDPVATGVRELREETGFEGTSARALGWVYANPAIMNNRAHFIVVEQCVHKHECEFDHGEDLVTRLVPWRDIPTFVREGKIRHPLVLVALYHYELSRRTT